MPTWRLYCARHGIGLVVFESDLIAKDSRLWKKRQWQKLLIGDELQKHLPTVRNVCYLDTDILINYTAPNVFDGYKEKTIGLVSQKRSLPYPLEDVLRRIAFYRHNYFSKDYPLDSALFMSVEKIYEYHNVAPQDDYACTGFYLFNVSEHSSLMKSWFEKYDNSITSLTDGGEEAHTNYEIQNYGNVSWMDYKWQALWIYEMAWKYPFLYDRGHTDVRLVRECIEASLHTNYFLHFAGSWPDSQMWMVGGFFENDRQNILLEEYSRYLSMPVTGVPRGPVKPRG